MENCFKGKKNKNLYENSWVSDLMLKMENLLLVCFFQSRMKKMKFDYEKFIFHYFFETKLTPLNGQIFCLI
ncbi:unnamed protein product [Blepharisma stoltei]|uniref:Uncharacterized protein n=1 Tax=Blepharisma stoltei TaxID=1481888 RepID=A0AAU9KM66_9CILI|nr:unnamed protein product [Blepharisma stoltei]